MPTGGSFPGGKAGIPIVSGSRRSCFSRRLCPRFFDTTTAFSNTSPTWVRSPRPISPRSSSFGRDWATTSAPGISIEGPGKYRPQASSLTRSKAGCPCPGSGGAQPERYTLSRGICGLRFSTPTSDGSSSDFLGWKEAFPGGTPVSGNCRTPLAGGVLGPGTQIRRSWSLAPSAAFPAHPSAPCAPSPPGVGCRERTSLPREAAPSRNHRESQRLPVRVEKGKSLPVPDAKG